MKSRIITLGKLTLGSGFLWSDLVIYSFGALLGYGLEKYYFEAKK